MDHYSTAQEVTREPTFCEKMTGQIANVNQELEAAQARLEKLYARMFGARPEPPTGNSKLQAVPSNATSEMREGASTSLSRAYAINGLISDLERAL